MVKAIIFDYDGTISDSLHIKTEAFAQLYSPHGKEIVEKVVKYHILNGGVSRFEKFRFFHEKLLNIPINDYEIEILANNFSKIVMEKVSNAAFIPGAYEFILNYSSIYDLYVSTATPTFEIIEILKRNKLIKFFKDIKGSPDNKTNHVKQIMLKESYKTNEVIFIGDSKSDEIAATNNNINFIKVIKGHSKIEKNKIPNLLNLNNIIQ